MSSTNDQQQGTADTAQHCCPTCSKTFKRNWHLMRHEQSHSSDRPFKCPLCARVFARQDTLSRHLTSHAKARIHKSGDRRLSATSGNLLSFTLPVSQPRNAEERSGRNAEVRVDPPASSLDANSIFKHVHMPLDLNVAAPTPASDRQTPKAGTEAGWTADHQLARTESSTNAATQETEILPPIQTLPDDLYNSRVDLQARQWLRDMCATDSRVASVPPNG